MTLLAFSVTAAFVVSPMGWTRESSVDVVEDVVVDVVGRTPGIAWGSSVEELDDDEEVLDFFFCDGASIIFTRAY